MRELTIDDGLSEQISQALSQSPLFSSLAHEQLGQVSQQATLVQYESGENVVAEGTASDAFYLILAGRARVLVGQGSEQVEVAQLQAGTIFGEISALTDAPRTASIQAVNHVVVQEISQRQIESIFLNNEAAMAEFAKVMAQREAGRKAFSADETEEFELGLVERMTKTFSRLMFS